MKAGASLSVASGFSGFKSIASDTRRVPAMRSSWMMIFVFLVVAAIAAGAPKSPGSSKPPAASWQILEAGLELGTFQAPRASIAGDFVIRVLRIDPERLKLRLLNASAPGQSEPLTAKEWCSRNGLVAAINASMYRGDQKTGLSLMKTGTHTNNPVLSKDKAVLAFDRLVPDIPAVKIIDRECEDFETWKNRYGTLIQSIRMISCRGGNVWSRQPRIWSTAAIGIDKQGKALFIHVRSPYSTHDFINMLLELPIGLAWAMYVEGGPEAQLYVRGPGQEYEFLGSYETGFFNENDQNDRAWPIPNVVGIARS
jgi:hypothetical protein